MKRRFILFLSLAVFFSFNLTLLAQDYYKKQNPAQKQNFAEEGISEERYKDLEKGQQAILKKIDQLLAGQEKIMQELKIIKVRASLK